LDFKSILMQLLILFFVPIGSGESQQVTKHRLYVISDTSDDEVEVVFKRPRLSSDTPNDGNDSTGEKKKTESDGKASSSVQSANTELSQPTANDQQTSAIRIVGTGETVMGPYRDYKVKSTVGSIRKAFNTDQGSSASKPVPSSNNTEPKNFQPSNDPIVTEKICTCTETADQVTKTQSNEIGMTNLIGPISGPMGANNMESIRRLQLQQQLRLQTSTGLNFAYLATLRNRRLLVNAMSGTNNTAGGVPVTTVTYTTGNSTVTNSSAGNRVRIFNVTRNPVGNPTGTSSSVRNFTGISGTAGSGASVAANNAVGTNNIAGAGNSTVTSNAAGNFAGTNNMIGNTAGNSTVTSYCYNAAGNFAGTNNMMVNTAGNSTVTSNTAGNFAGINNMAGNSIVTSNAAGNSTVTSSAVGSFTGTHTAGNRAKNSTITSNAADNLTNVNNAPTGVLSHMDIHRDILRQQQIASNFRASRNYAAYISPGNINNHLSFTEIMQQRFGPQLRASQSNSEATSQANRNTNNVNYSNNNSFQIGNPSSSNNSAPQPGPSNAEDPAEEEVRQLKINVRVLADNLRDEVFGNLSSDSPQYYRQLISALRESMLKVNSVNAELGPNKTLRRMEPPCTPPGAKGRVNEPQTGAVSPLLSKSNANQGTYGNVNQPQIGAEYPAFPKPPGGTSTSTNINQVEVQQPTSTATVTTENVNQVQPTTSTLTVATINPVQPNASTLAVATINPVQPNASTLAVATINPVQPNASTLAVATINPVQPNASTSGLTGSTNGNLLASTKASIGNLKQALSNAQQSTSTNQGGNAGVQNKDINPFFKQIADELFNISNDLNKILSQSVGNQSNAQNQAGQPPVSNQAGAPASNQAGQPPVSNQARASASNQARAPASNQAGQPPVSNQARAPASNQADQPPVSNQARASASNQARAPASNQAGQPPVSNRAGAPASNQAGLPGGSISNQAGQPPVSNQAGFVGRAHMRSATVPSGENQASVAIPGQNQTDSSARVVPYRLRSQTVPSDRNQAGSSGLPRLSSWPLVPVPYVPNPTAFLNAPKKPKPTPRTHDLRELIEFPRKTRMQRIIIDSEIKHDLSTSLNITRGIKPTKLKLFLPDEWSCHDTYDLHNFNVTDLESNHKEYAGVVEKIRKTCQRPIAWIKRIENPYLYGMYLLKRAELIAQFGFCNEQMLFHGTRSENVAKISQENLDWRKHGKSSGHSYGRGVYFASNAYLASHYAKNSMFLVRMLVTWQQNGFKDTALPEGNCDTTTSIDGSITVKYDDFTFYPEYLVQFV
jgi:hypothetical protein